MLRQVIPILTAMPSSKGKAMSVCYIAACVFTAAHPALSECICHYLKGRGIPSVRCCIRDYKTNEMSARMPDDRRDFWTSLPQCAPMEEGDTLLTVCHNCTNLLTETRPDLRVKSLWEWIDEDDNFPLPNLRSRTFAVQDCWRARERKAERNAVRSLLLRCGANLVELPHTEDFCGVSLYRPQPPRNPTLAPRLYANQPGKFLPHTAAEQEALMRTHCAAIAHPIVCYCHYCLEGLRLGGADAHHLGEILFGE